MGNTTRCRLLVVEDDSIIRRGLVLNIPWEENGIEVVGSARNGREGLKMARELLPEIVLTDIRMPFLDGLAFAERLKELEPAVSILFLTAYEDFGYAQAALRLKASDYLLKYASNEDILAAVLHARDEWLLERDEAGAASRGRAVSTREFLAQYLRPEGVALGLPSETQGTLATPAINSGLPGLDLLGVLPPGPWIVAAFSAPPGGVEILSREAAAFLAEAGWLSAATEIDGKAVLVVGAHDDCQTVAEDLLGSISALLLDNPKTTGMKRYCGLSDPRTEVAELGAAWEEARETLSVLEALDGPLAAIHGWIMESVNHKRLRAALDYMASNFHRPGLGLVETADAVGVSPAYLSTIFKRCGDFNFRDHLAALRVGQAKKLLAIAHMPVHEVSGRVGCPNPHHFSVMFRRVAGLSPNEYRQSLTRSSSA